MERLSTGKRINSAGDDAAGLAISARMASQVKGLEQASRNVADGVSMVQTIEGAGKEILNIMTRMKELAVQARSETYSDTDRDALDLEFQELIAEIERIADNTEWNGMALMGADNGTIEVQVGDGATQHMDVVFKDWQTAGGDAYSDISGLDIDVVANAETALGTLDTAITEAAEELAKYGAYINRLETAQDNLLNVAANTDASRSRIEDADYARETTSLAKTQIISQASTAMLAQANQIKQTVLALLQ
jgi:flagellin